MDIPEINFGNIKKPHLILIEICVELELYGGGRGAYYTLKTHS